MAEPPAPRIPTTNRAAPASPPLQPDRVAIDTFAFREYRCDMIRRGLIDGTFRKGDATETVARIRYSSTSPYPRMRCICSTPAENPALWPQMALIAAKPFYNPVTPKPGIPTPEFQFPTLDS